MLSSRLLSSCLLSSSELSSPRLVTTLPSVSLPSATLPSATLLLAILQSATLLSTAAADAAPLTAYKCTIDGATLYADRPCTTGRSATLTIGPADPSSDDRRAALARSHDEQRALAALERDRALADREALKSSRVAAARRHDDRECARLALRAHRAHDDMATATPRDESKLRRALRRADDDYAVACKTR